MGHYAHKLAQTESVRSAGNHDGGGYDWAESLTGAPEEAQEGCPDLLERLH